MFEIILNEKSSTERKHVFKNLKWLWTHYPWHCILAIGLLLVIVFGNEIGKHVSSTLLTVILFGTMFFLYLILNFLSCQIPHISSSEDLEELRKIIMNHTRIISQEILDVLLVEGENYTKSIHNLSFLVPQNFLTLSAMIFATLTSVCTAVLAKATPEQLTDTLASTLALLLLLGCALVILGKAVEPIVNSRLYSAKTLCTNLNDLKIILIAEKFPLNSGDTQSGIVNQYSDETKSFAASVLPQSNVER